MKNKTIRLLTISLIAIAFVCVMVFTFLASFLGRKNTQMISEIGTIYMAGMNERIEMHFKSTIDTQLSQLESIVEEIPEENISDYALMEEDLKYSAEGRNFQYLALYSGDGDFEMITGEQVMLADPEPFWESMKKGDKKIAVGVDASANDIVLFGIRAELPMADGRKSIALVAGIPDEYIVRVLALEENDSLVYSHVIRRDGSFVIKSIATEKNSYFEQVRAIVDEEAGKSAETYVEELQSAMRERKRYSTVLHMEGSRSHLYCTSLPNSEWYLVTVMPYGAMDETVSHFSAIQVTSIFIGSGIILFGLLVVFILYLNLSRRQMEELEKAREEAVHATRAKSEFLSNMSHDIRTPMNAIVGMTAIAVANIDDKKQIQNCLKKITLSSKHLLGLINDVLDMSKIESGKLTLHIEQISLREVMDSIVNIVQPQIKEKKQHFSVHIRNVEAEDVYCDSVRLNQVLINLLSNAIKFTPEEGRVNVYLMQEPSSLGENYVRCHFRVKDTGIGMSPEFLKTIFETFTREKNTQVQKTEGTGLGMAITKAIVEAMNGTIEVTSEQGKGSEFHITLDLERVEEKDADMVLPPWRMLVVDNNEDLCYSTVVALKEIGVEVEYALSGEAAVQMVAKRCKQQDHYQIILLDWKMPGMDGLETTKAIRKYVGDEVTILIISAYDWSDIEDEAREAGAQGFISKPLFKSNLFSGLKHYMEEDGENKESESAVNIESMFDGKKILVAEDNDLNWEIAEELFSERGLNLERAENGKDCVEKFEQSQEGYYDLILMDIRMPVMSGYDAAKAIRALSRSDAGLPIIAMTADAFSDDIQRCMDCGMNAHIAKPIDVNKVIQQMRKYIK